MWSSRSERPAASRCGGIGPARRGLTVAPFALLGLVLSSCVSGPVRTLRSNVESIDAGPLQQTSQNNLLQIAAQDFIGPDLVYRVDDTFTYSSQRNELPGSSSTNNDDLSLHRPTLELALTQGPLLWTQMYRMQQDRTLLDNGPDNELLRKDLLQRFDWTPDGLPQLTAWFNYRTIEDEFFVDQEEIETRLILQQDLGVFDYSYSLREQLFHDRNRDTDNDQLEHALRGSYEDLHLDDRLSTTVNVFLGSRDSTVDVPSSGGPAGIQVFAPRGFSDVDLTPQISALTVNPGLIDGNTLAGTGIDIGGFATGGQLSWNMAVELPPGAAVDSVELQTAASVPQNFVNQFAFSVWVSDDNTFWTLVQGSTPFIYDQANLHFRLSIPSVSNRYLKVVNTASPAAAPQVLVTEMEVFRQGVGGNAATLRSDETIKNSTGNFSYQLTDTWKLGYDVLVQTTDSNSAGSTIRDERRLDNGLWATWTPSEKFEANARASEQRIDDEVLSDQTLRSLLGVLTYRPLSTLDIDLTYNLSDRDLDDRDDNQIQAAQLLGTAQLLRTLRAELLFERSINEDSINQREIARWITSAALIAQVTASLELTLRLRSDQADVSGAGAVGIPNPSEERYESSVLYRPTERFILEYQLNWLDNFAGAGLDQRINVDWIPFEDGAIDLQFDYNHVQNRSVNDATYDRWRALARWTLDPRVYFELQYTGDLPQNGVSTETVLLSFNFNS